MSTPIIPTAEQLAETRKKLWHQGGDALLTVESLRAWLDQAGLVLFTSRAQQLPGPAPSLVEAVLGHANSAPTLAESEQARTLTMRLVAEGSAVPLNLLGAGATGDTPDFVCSSQVFSYIFTLRGDKAWKQPPATSGAVKVSPLALATYELLAAPGTALSAADLATELGKEVTEAAVVRGLTELWSQLRVVPVAQQDGPVLWELMSARYTKHIKAGANAGQPSALSALISLYLGMAVVASEEEVETILSPLAPRSRIRDVVHALMGARQLETIAVDGRTVLHVAGDLPEFASRASGAVPEADGGPDTIEVEGVGPAEPGGEQAPGSRITKFVPKPRKTGTGPTKAFTARPGAPARGDERQRRPFQKKSSDGPSRPSFTKPWNEDRPTRPSIAAEGGPDSSGEGRPTRPAFSRDKPQFGGKEGGMRPTFRRDAGEGSGERPARKTFSKPGTFGRKRDDAGGRPAYGGSDSRPPRREFSSRPPASNAGPRPASFGDRPERPKRTYGDRPAPDDRSAQRGERRPGSYTPRPASGDGFAARKPFAPREGGSFAPGKPFSPGGKPPSRAPRDGDAGGGTESLRKVYRKFDAPRSDRPSSDRPGFDKPRRPRAEGAAAERPFSDRPKRPYSKPGGESASGPGGYAGKKPFARPGASSGARPGARPGGKPPGTFAKFADGNKPFRKPGPGGGKSFGGKPRSAAPSTYRKRKPEEGGA